MIKNISYNLLTSLSLTFIAILTYLIFCLVFEVVLVIVCQIFTNYNLDNIVLIIEQYSLYINLLALIFLISPLNLSIKNWYYNLGKKEKTNLLQAFIVFSSFSYYFKSILFCFVKTLINIFNSILILLPTACVIAIFKFMILYYEYSNTLATIVLFVGFLLFIIGVFICIINYSKFTFIDYVFLSSMNNKNSLFSKLNYFKMMKSETLISESIKN